MNVYLALVILTVPSPSGPSTVELARELVSASSAAVCVKHAEALAEEQRGLHIDAVKRLGGVVTGVCRPAGASV